MPRHALLLTFLAAFTAASAAHALTVDEARLRLDKAANIAKLQNSADRLRRVEAAGREVRRAFERRDEAAAEQAVQQAELAAGLDAGGRSMNGIAIYSPTPDMVRALQALGPRLTAAMKRGDAAAVRTCVEEAAQTLGDELGKPENAVPGRRADPRRATEAETTALFLRLLDEGKSRLRGVSEGKPTPHVMARFYAELVRALCMARPLVEKHAPQRLADIDALVAGGCRIMLDIQCPEGHFPFPDLRGVNIRWAPIIQKLVDENPGAVRDGWVVTVDAGGGSQFDTGECGEALLRAGMLYGNAAWKQAGLRAADWAITQDVVANFNYNAFSVMLLARAFEVTSENRYLDAALAKWRVGVAPGQVSSGRWVDAHNAKTVYHLIILRGLHELLAVLPEDRAAERTELRRSTAAAVKTVLDEMDQLGVVNGSFLLQQLDAHRRLHPAPDPRLSAAMQLAASVAFTRSSDENEGGFRGSATAVSPAELIHIHRAWLPR